jgi:hypothetical protein
MSKIDIEARIEAPECLWLTDCQQTQSPGSKRYPIPGSALIRRGLLESAPVSPFGILLLAIAFGPLIAHRHWERLTTSHFKLGTQRDNRASNGDATLVI